LGVGVGQIVFAKPVLQIDRNGNTEIVPKKINHKLKKTLQIDLKK
jgi:hypothetical protein